jgi:hypothetical protein
VVTVCTAADNVETEINLGERRQPDPLLHARSLLRVGFVGLMFLSQLALEGFQLLLGIGHPIGFVVTRQDAGPFRKCGFVELHGAAGLPEFEVHVRQVLKNGGIVPHAVNRFRKILLRFGEFALLEANPSQGVEIRAINGILIDGVLDE